MPDAFSFSLQRDQLYKQVAEQLQQMILSEELRPGAKLPGERELAERLQVSRTVVREAIRALAVRGLLKIKPGCGTYVRALDAKDVSGPIELFLRLYKSPDRFDELFQVRRMIEIECAGLAAAHASQDDLATLERAVEGMAENVDDPETFTRQDLAFHMALASATHNGLLPLLLSPITRLLFELILLSVHGPSASERGLYHHKSILEAIRKGDHESAREAMRDHLRTSQELVNALREQLEDSFNGQCTDAGGETYK